MSLEMLSFLAEPWFVLPWYAVGILGAAWVAYDVAKINTPLKKAMKWAWPIITLFFSVIGLALYYGTVGLTLVALPEVRRPPMAALRTGLVP